MTGARWTAPNLLGAFRLLATGVIVLLVLLGFPGAGLAAFVVFIPAALSDLADGWLARRRGQVSMLGMFLDQTADKVLVAGVLIALIPSGVVVAWMVVVIVLREVVVGGVRQFAASADVVVRSELLGKAKTVVTLVAIAPLLLAFDARTGGPMTAVGPATILLVAGTWILFAGMVLSLASAVDYLQQAWPVLRASAGERRPT